MKRIDPFWYVVAAGYSFLLGIAIADYTHGEAQGGDENKWDTEQLALLMDTVIAVSTVGLWVLTIWALKSSKKSVDSYINSERGKVGVDLALDWADPRGFVEQITIRNYGSSPVRVMAFQSIALTYKMDPSKYTADQMPKPIDKIPSIGIYDMLIPEGAEIRSGSHGFGMPLAIDSKKVRAGTHRALFQYIVLYQTNIGPWYRYQCAWEWSGGFLMKVHHGGFEWDYPIDPGDYAVVWGNDTPPKGGMMSKKESVRFQKEDAKRNA